MKHICFTLLLLSLASFSYSQPSKVCSTATVMNVPDTVWEYCSLLDSGMVRQPAFLFNTTFPQGDTVFGYLTKAAWYKFTVPTGKGIHACIIDMPVGSAFFGHPCTQYPGFFVAADVYKGANCNNLTRVYYNILSSCYDPGFGNGWSGQHYSPAIIDSLEEGQTYYLKVFAQRPPDVNLSVGIKWLPYLKQTDNCLTGDTITTFPFRGCNFNTVYNPTPAAWLVNECSYQTGGMNAPPFNPVHYTIIPTNNTFSITLTHPVNGFGAKLHMYVFKDCSHLGDYTMDSVTHTYKYYYGCAADSSFSGVTSANLTITNATPGVPLTLVVDAGYYCGEFQNCGTWDVFDIMASGVVMPVKLQTFTAQYLQVRNNVLLKWSAAIEAAKYIVEKSYNGSSFLTIGEVKGENENLHHYSFTDNVNLYGKLYYRLKIIDKDGKAAYSKTEIININSSSFATVYPNPTHNAFNIIYTSQLKGVLNIVMLNAEGKKVYNTSQQIDDGKSMLSIKLPHLLKGIYFIKIKAPGELDCSVQRVVIE